jgi:hypothetical protein
MSKGVEREFEILSHDGTSIPAIYTEISPPMKRKGLYYYCMVSRLIKTSGLIFI